MVLLLMRGLFKGLFMSFGWVATLFERLVAFLSLVVVDEIMLRDRRVCGLPLGQALFSLPA